MLGGDRVKTSDMTPIETFDAALERLEAIIKATVEAGEPVPGFVSVATAMFIPTVRLLRQDAHMLRSCTTPEQRKKVEDASERAGDLAIARAVLEAMPHMPQYETKETK